MSWHPHRTLLALLFCLLPATCAPPALAADAPLSRPAALDDGLTGVVTAAAPTTDEPLPVPVGTWPLRPQPSVQRPFDPPDAPWGAGHRGVDLLGVPGQRVHTALPGRVRFVGRIAGRGVVVVDHGATRTTYEPVVGSISVGTQVAIGAVVGHLELVGSHCLPAACLHWGWIRNRDDAYLDPLLLVGARPVRLFPWGGPSG